MEGGWFCRKQKRKTQGEQLVLRPTAVFAAPPETPVKDGVRAGGVLGVKNGSLGTDST